MKTTFTNQKNNFKRLTKVLGIGALICLGLKANAQQQCIANYTYADDTVNTGNVIFTNTASIGNSPLTYLWDFGDGSTSNLANPNHVFSNFGSSAALVCLTVADANGTTCIFCDSVYIGGYTGVACHANFYSEPDSNSVNGVDFWNYSGGSPSNFSWNFGDNTTSSLENPHHIFADSGTYNVCLTIIDSMNNCQNTYCESVIVGNHTSGGCQAYFYTYPDSSNANTIHFSNYSSGTPSTYSWNFGDNTTSNLENPNHGYINAGTYHVCLTIADSSNNCQNTYCDDIVVGNQNGGICQAYFTNTISGNTATFVNNATAGTNYFWDFGDGSSLGYGQTAIHTYANPGTYTVCFQYNHSDSTGVWDTCNFCTTIVVGNQNGCHANFTNTVSGNTATFINNAIGGTNYAWNFGDGSWGYGQTAAHTYAYPGPYTVCFQYNYSDSTGVWDTCNYCETIVVGNQNGLCQANFNLVSDSTDNTFIWVYDYSVCGNNGNGNCSYVWDFGDGTSSTSQYFPTHNYVGNGPFNLCLTVGDGNGCSNTYCDSIYLGRSSAGITLGIVNHPAGINETKNINTLLENYPNPFNGSTTINYSLSKNADVELTVVDLMGNKIATVESGSKSSGNQSTVWNADNVASGMYLLQLKINNQITTKKIIINK